MAAKFLSRRYLNVLWAGCVLFGFSGAARVQQTGEKVVRAEQASQITDAVAISNVAVAGKTLECGLFIKPPTVMQPVTPFQAGIDWLPQMTISLVNRTNKIIVFGGIGLHFPDTGDCRALPCVAGGMKWAGGMFSVPDPEHPGKFKALPADYFPGRRSNNWPPGYER